MLVVAGGVLSAWSTAKIARQWWIFKSAWIGDRAGPAPAWLSEKAAAKRRRELAEQAAENAIEDAYDAAYRRMDQTRRWLEAGMPRAEAPDPSLAVAADDVPSRVEITELEASAIYAALGAPMIDAATAIDGEPPERQSQRAKRNAAAAQLVQRGVLRRTGDVYELAPELLPVLGLALASGRAAAFWLGDDVADPRHDCFAFPGHFVVADRLGQPGLEADDSPAVFRRSSVDAVLDEIVALTSSRPPTPSEPASELHRLWFGPRAGGRIGLGVDADGRFHASTREYGQLPRTIIAGYSAQQLRSYLRPMILG